MVVACWAQALVRHWVALLVEAEARLLAPWRVEHLAPQAVL